MKSEDSMVFHRWLLRVVPRLMPLVTGVVGWHFGRWWGAIAGFVIGCVLAMIFWIVGYYFFARARLLKQRQEMAALPSEELKNLATDPSRREMAFAIAELERRGIKNIRPSVESLLELLTSAHPNQRAIGFTNLSIMYPSVFRKIAKEGSASTDAPEVWRERIAAWDRTG